jgi:outer membrane murein-binding lipoprotein Lpp
VASEDSKVKELLERIKRLNAKQNDIETRMKNVEAALKARKNEK